MSIPFSSSSDNLGIVEQSRGLVRLDSNQWPTYKIVASVNNYHDTVTGYAIGADRRFQWDDTNHTKLPIGTVNLLGSQQEYSFLTDEQGNAILNLTRVDILDPSGLYRKLIPIDQAEIPIALDEFAKTPGFPIYYDKTADNIIKLYPGPISSIANGLKLYFQRTGSYFTAADTTKAPGVPPLLHRGYVIAAAYDAALTLSLENLGVLGGEFQKEQQKMIDYFSNRNTDEAPFIVKAKFRSSR